MLSHAPWTWRDAGCGAPFTLVYGGEVRVYYRGEMGGRNRIGLATAPLAGFHPTLLRDHPACPLLDVGLPGAWDAMGASCPTVVRWRGAWTMFFQGHSDAGAIAIGAATSVDGIMWMKYPGNPLLHGGAPSVELVDDSTLRLWRHDGGALVAAVTNDGIVWEETERVATRPGQALAPMAPDPAPLAPGERGAWDDGGIGPTSLLEAGGRTWLLYEAWGAGYRDALRGSAAAPSPPQIGAAELIYVP